jgi:hypothetical protein
MYCKENTSALCLILAKRTPKNDQLRTKYVDLELDIFKKEVKLSACRKPRKQLVQHMGSQ